jgi:hypothetical protein
MPFNSTLLYYIALCFLKGFSAEFGINGDNGLLKSVGYTQESANNDGSGDLTATVARHTATAFLNPYQNISLIYVIWQCEYGKINEKYAIISSFCRQANM